MLMERRPAGESPWRANDSGFHLRPGRSLVRVGTIRGLVFVKQARLPVGNGSLLRTAREITPKRFNQLEFLHWREAADLSVKRSVHSRKLRIRSVDSSFRSPDLT